jgi:hypothetical protein
MFHIFSAAALAFKLFPSSNTTIYNEDTFEKIALAGWGAIPRSFGLYLFFCQFSLSPERLPAFVCCVSVSFRPIMPTRSMY